MTAGSRLNTLDTGTRRPAHKETRETRHRLTRRAQAPRQDRSRESFDRILEAATALFAAGGYHSLTLTEVSRKARVSIGSIYCRVASKDELVQAVQERSMTHGEREFIEILVRLRRRRLSLRRLVPALVNDFAAHLKRHAPLISSLIERAAFDPVIAEAARHSLTQTELDFRLLLLEHRSEIVHPDPERATSTCFSVVYGLLAQRLGLSIRGSRAGDDEADWNRLVSDLGLMCLAFLATDLGHLREPDGA